MSLNSKIEDSNFYSNLSFLNPQKSNKEKLNHFSLDINESFYSMNKDDKYISTENNEYINNYFNFDDFENNKEDELINNFNINEKNINKDEMKKQLRLKRNRQSAKEGRLRKKIYIENIMNKINELQMQNSLLLNIISKCQNCKDEYRKEIEKNNQMKNNYILNNDNSNSKKSKLLFMTTITLLSILNLFNIFSFNQQPSSLKHKRILSAKDQGEVFLNKLKSENEEDGLFIHFSEYYSLTTREKVNYKYDINNEINKNIKIYNYNKFNVNKINQTNAKECVKCVVELDKNSINIGGDELTFYLVDRLLSKNFSNDLEDGLFPEIDFKEWNKKSETFSKVFALRCKIIGYSINNLYTQKIHSIS